MLSVLKIIYLAFSPHFGWMLLSLDRVCIEMHYGIVKGHMKCCFTICPKEGILAGRHADYSSLKAQERTYDILKYCLQRQMSMIWSIVQKFPSTSTIFGSVIQ